MTEFLIAHGVNTTDLALSADYKTGAAAPDVTLPAALDTR